MLNTPPMNMPHHEARFSHDGHFTLQLVHLSSCTTQGQIQGENDYAIVKVSTTTMIIATHNEVTSP